MKLTYYPITTIREAKGKGLVCNGPMSPMLAAKDLATNLFGDAGIPMQPSVTTMFRVECDDKTMFTTWQHADIEPVSADVLIAIFSYTTIILFADLGGNIMPIGLKTDKDRDVIYTPVFDNYPWIAVPDKKDLTALLNGIDPSTYIEELLARDDISESERADVWFSTLGDEARCKMAGFLLTKAKECRDWWKSLPATRKAFIFKCYHKVPA